MIQDPEYEIADKLYLELYGSPKTHGEYANSFNITGKIVRILRSYQINNVIETLKSTTEFKIYLNSILNVIPEEVHNELWNKLINVINEIAKNERI